MAGLTFSPFNQSPNGQPPGQAAAPVQDAIKILSFRMPSVVGGGAPAPGALLGGQSGFGSQLQGSLAQQLLRRLLSGQMGAGAPPAGGPALSGPQGLGSTNPFSVPASPTNGPGASNASGLTPNIQFGHGSVIDQPTTPDPVPPPEYPFPAPTAGNPVGTEPLPRDPGSSPPTSSPVTSMPMPRDPGGNDQNLFSGGFGGRGGRF